MSTSALSAKCYLKNEAPSENALPLRIRQPWMPEALMIYSPTLPRPSIKTTVYLRFADVSLDGQLLPHTLKGVEAVSAIYRLELLCLCSDTTPELKRLMGQSVDIAIGLFDSGERVISGVVTQYLMMFISAYLS